LEINCQSSHQDHKIEKLNLNLCKSILGVGSKASNLTVVGELGRYPLYIDIVISMIKYWIRLHEDKTNCILKAALDVNNKMHNNGQHCWVSCIYYILKELDMLTTTAKFEALLPTPQNTLA
jgi:hypothetical protein